MTEIDFSKFEGHTPGPWSYDEAPPYGTPFVEAEGKMVAMVVGDSTEAEANLALIAAAPALLAQLASKDAQIKALTEALEKHDAFVRELCADVFPRSIDGDYLQKVLAKHGLYRVEPFDPAKHSDWSGASEAGDDFYVPTGIARAALAGTEGSSPSTQETKP